MTPIVLAFLLGLLTGISGTLIVSRLRTIGDLRVDTSDTDSSPYLFMELKNEKSMGQIQRSRYVTMRVNLESYIPHD